MARTRNAALPATRADIADTAVLGSLPLLPGEDRAEYARFRAAVIAMMKPADLMEKIWTNDIIYLEWEILRFRRAKANLIRRRAANCLSLPGLGGSSEPDPDADLAAVIAANIDKLEPLDWMIARMEQRRNAAYLQAEQHRVNLGNLRRSVEQVEDAEYRELGHETSEEKRTG
jgi:hypothetical protein